MERYFFRFQISGAQLRSRMRKRSIRGENHMKKLSIILGLLMILTAIVLPILYWESIPQHIPTSWYGLRSYRDTLEKSAGFFALIPILQTVILAMFLLFAYLLQLGIMKSVSFRSIEANPKQENAFQIAWASFLANIAPIVLAILLAVQFQSVFVFENIAGVLIITLAGVAIIIAYAIRLVVKYGIRGERFEG